MSAEAAMPGGGIGGARGNVAAISFDAGATWTNVAVLGITLCPGGEFERASDPWVSFAPNGDVYFMSLVTDAAPPEGRGEASARTRCS